MSTFIILNIIAILLDPANSAHDCDNAYQCTGTSIIESSRIDCLGDHSCYKAESIQSTGSSDIRCSAAYSCSHANSIQHTGTSSYTSIECHGFNSCSDVVYNITNNYGSIECSGEQSCMNDKNIILNNVNIFCYGDSSCKNSIIHSNMYDSNEHYMYGHLSGMNNVYYGNDGGIYRFQGKNSGHNVTIICGDGKECEIHCKGDGCNGVTTRCSNNTGENNCTFSVNCAAYTGSYSFKNELCPDGLQLSSFMFEIPSLIDLKFSTYENSVDLCNSSKTNAINCGDYGECGYSIELDSTSTGIVYIVCLNSYCFVSFA